MNEKSGPLRVDEDEYTPIFRDINNILMSRKYDLRIAIRKKNKDKIYNIVNNVSTFIDDLLCIDCSDEEKDILRDFIIHNEVIIHIALMIPKDCNAQLDYTM